MPAKKAAKAPRRVKQCVCGRRIALSCATCGRASCNRTHRRERNAKTIVDDDGVIDVVSPTPENFATMHVARQNPEALGATSPDLAAIAANAQVLVSACDTIVSIIETGLRRRRRS